METLKRKYKGRVRLVRGQLESFEELPSLVKTDLIEIKKILNDYFNKELDVFVFGSYYHGFWDEFSDYDVIINEGNNGVNLTELFKGKIETQVHVISTKNKLSNVLIP
jgi:predicted nucleotidyltransferase